MYENELVSEILSPSVFFHKQPVVFHADEKLILGLGPNRLPFCFFLKDVSVLPYTTDLIAF